VIVRYDTGTTYRYDSKYKSSDANKNFFQFFVSLKMKLISLYLFSVCVSAFSRFALFLVPCLF
jgi:hypothetical protein